MARLKADTLNLRIDPMLKEAANQCAADDRRSLTSLVENLLADHLTQKGYLKDPKKKAKNVTPRA